MAKTAYVEILIEPQGAASKSGWVEAAGYARDTQTRETGVVVIFKRDKWIFYPGTSKSLMNSVIEGGGNAIHGDGLYSHYYENAEVVE